MDPARGLFFKGGGIADFYIAWKDGKPAGTIVSSREKQDSKENMFGFFECFDNYAIAEALFKQAETWAREHHLTSIIGTYNLDREDCRGILIEGPTVLLHCYAVITRHIIRVSLNAMVLGWNTMMAWLMPLISI